MRQTISSIIFMQAIEWRILPLLFFFFIPVTAMAQSTATAEPELTIRKLEAEQVGYLVSGNVGEMKKNWDPDFTVNNPFNVVQHGATGPIQTGALTYHKFERNIEKVLVFDSVVVVMGNEVVLPKTAPAGSSHDTNQSITRRFTNVWMFKGGKWMMIARQASNVCK